LLLYRKKYLWGCVGGFHPFAELNIYVDTFCETYKGKEIYKILMITIVFEADMYHNGGDKIFNKNYNY